jgi:hypothetical protein
MGWHSACIIKGISVFICYVKQHSYYSQLYYSQKKMLIMKKVIYPIVLVAGFVGLMSASVQATTATTCMAGLVAADSTPPDTTKPEAPISAGYLAELVAADSTPPDTTKSVATISAGYMAALVAADSTPPDTTKSEAAISANYMAKLVAADSTPPDTTKLVAAI